MEFTALTSFLKWGTPGGILALIIWAVYIAATLKNMKDSFDDMKKKIIFRDTHDEIEKAHDLRFVRIEDDVRLLNHKVFDGKK